MDATLPLDIWWLVCDELAWTGDFNSLLSLSRTSQTMATLALPVLYGIQEETDSYDLSVSKREKLISLWRAIILSSVGQTLFPYCIWIKYLKLGDLKELLRDIAPNPTQREMFFEGPMASFEITMKIGAMSTRHTPARLAFQEISHKVGEVVTRFVKEAAERNNTAMALTRLEGEYIPMDLLSLWTSRLTALTTLKLEDGSVIEERLGASLRINCPKFRELTCFYCDGPTVDENIAGFLKALQPNTLEVFRVISKNRLDREALPALALHAGSLKTLMLSSLQFSALGHLGALRQCVALRRLDLEGDHTVSADWAALYPDAFAEVVSWLGACSSLRFLSLSSIPSGGTLLKTVFESPSLQVDTLHLRLREEDDDFFSSFAKQKSLEEIHLVVANRQFETSTQRDRLIQSISLCSRLTVLNVANVDVTTEDLHLWASTLKQIKDLSFGGVAQDDSVFDALLAMPQLTSIKITATATFTVEGIARYINALAEKIVPRDHLSLHILGLSPWSNITIEQEVSLVELASTKLNMLLDIAHLDDDY